MMQARGGPVACTSPTRDASPQRCFIRGHAAARPPSPQPGSLTREEATILPSGSPLRDATTATSVVLLAVRGVQPNVVPAGTSSGYPQPPVSSTTVDYSDLQICRFEHTAAASTSAAAPGAPLAPSVARQSAPLATAPPVVAVAGNGRWRPSKIPSKPSVSCRRSHSRAQSALRATTAAEG